MAQSQEIPNEMRAAVFDHYGKPSVVHVETVPIPKLGKHDVLVQVAIAGVGTWDPALVGGEFKDIDVELPRIVGSDGAGTVAMVGSGVKRFKHGDRVYGWGFGNRKGGFFAEYAAIPERDLAKIPDAISFEDTGPLAVAGITALQGLEHLGLDEGDSVIIFGASGGVGHVAVQLAEILGLRVFAVASRDDGVELARKLGADGVADGHARTLLGELREFAPDGFDGALVFAGAKGWGRELELVRRGGVIAYPEGVEPAPEVTAGRKRKVYNGEDSPAAFTRLTELIERGPFKLELSQTYPLDAIAKALQDVQHHHVGKLAIKI